jgi:hypothetical protein
VCHSQLLIVSNQVRRYIYFASADLAPQVLVVMEPSKGKLQIVLNRCRNPVSSPGYICDILIQYLHVWRMALTQLERLEAEVSRAEDKKQGEFPYRYQEPLSRRATLSL